MVNPRAYFAITIGGVPKGNLVFELFDDVVPKTAANFLHLCAGDKGTTKDGIPLTYKGSGFHRCIKGFMLQGGDFTRGNGTGGESIYGEKFEDENFVLKHDKPFLLSMANAGPGTNGSQFFLTTVPTPHLDGKHVVFGRLLSGKSLARLIESLPTESDKPTSPVVIADCGILKEEEDAPSDGVSGGIEGDVWEDWPQDEEDVGEDNLEASMKVAAALKEIGTREFKKANIQGALDTFEKALRYLDVHPVTPDGTSEDVEKAFESLRFSLLSNISLCYLKLPKPQPRNTINFCSRALRLNITTAEKIKMLFRRGVAYTSVNDDEQAEKDFKKGLELAPEDKAVQLELAKLEKRKKEKLEKARKAYSKMFA